ncbi:hypothetical protein J4462_00645 [Candidatus Pacearchaeota archaeon]|nr:hypothetical protein [Candidatus Pacearchaeota archaeon]
MMNEDEKFSKQIVQELLDIIEWGKRLNKIIPQRDLSREEMEEFVLMHLDWWISFFEVAYLWFCAEDIKQMIDKELDKIWKDFDYDEESVTLSHFKESVYRPMKWPLSSVEQRDLLSITKLQGKEIQEALHKHVEKYKHLALHNIDDECFNEDYYKSRLHSLENDEEYENQKRLMDTADKEVHYATGILNSSSLPTWIKDRIDFVRWFMYIRTESIDHFMLVNSAYKSVFKSLSKEFNLAMEEVLHMTYEEIIYSLRKGELTISKELIKSRTHEGYAFLIGVHGSYITTGKEVDELHKLLIPDEGKKEIKELKGQTAFKGIVKGRARIILDRRNSDELKKGEILVTTMTSPEFVPAMKLSEGIITNEGGVLCHAAIMSRELRKPCVIGTKIATEVIKTGDIIELDADTGIVRILKKPS